MTKRGSSTRKTLREMKLLRKIKKLKKKNKYLKKYIADLEVKQVDLYDLVMAFNTAYNKQDEDTKEKELAIKFLGQLIDNIEVTAGLESEFQYKSFTDMIGDEITMEEYDSHLWSNQFPDELEEVKKEDE